MKHKWTQPSYPQGKYERLFHAQQILAAGRLIQLLDTLEPIIDLTQAQEYLAKFSLKQ